MESDLSAILAKIKAVDGPDSNIVPFMEAYELTYSEAALWERHLWYVWEVLEAEYVANGPSETLDNTVLSLLIARDVQLYVENSGGIRFSTEFRRYIDRLQNRVDDFRNRSGNSE